MLSFNGQQFPCGELHSTLHKHSYEILTTRTNFWGLDGVSEIFGEAISPEIIEADVWLYEGFTYDENGMGALLAYLEELDLRRGENGILQQSGLITKQFHNCTFEGFEYVTLDGQTRPDPVPLCGNCNWMQAGTLKWTTLRWHNIEIPEPPPNQ